MITFRPQRRLLKFIALVVILVVGLLYATLVWTRHTPGLSLYQPYSPMQTAEDKAVTQQFLTQTDPEKRYDTLTSYFARGFIKYASPDGALVNYPGLPSSYGYHVSGVEGFARTAPLIAAWINKTERFDVSRNGKSVNFAQYLRRALLAGTDPQNPDYWGDVKDYDQRIVEAVDIARLLWLTRDYIWETLSPTEKKQIKVWLQQSLEHKVHANNWLLFPTVIQVILNKLDGHSTPSTYSPYQEFKSFYAESGWFFDAPHGFDYYNAWGIPYDLFWIIWVDPDFDTAFIRQVIADSANLTAHLISTNGVPMIGRSICYRTGVPVPILARSLLDPHDNVPARRSLDAIWHYFVKGGILIDNTMTQGYLATDPRLLDLYSGPGSCHWGLRSLVLAWMQPEYFWHRQSPSLPIEVGDFLLTLDKIGWTVQGIQKTGEIIITIPSNGDSQNSLQESTLEAKIKAALLFKPSRPKNDAYKYLRHTYSSLRPPQ